MKSTMLILIGALAIGLEEVSCAAVATTLNVNSSVPVLSSAVNLTNGLKNNVVLTISSPLTKSLGIDEDTTNPIYTLVRPIASLVLPDELTAVLPILSGVLQVLGSLTSALVDSIANGTVETSSALLDVTNGITTSTGYVLQGIEKTQNGVTSTLHNTTTDLVRTVTSLANDTIYGINNGIASLTTMNSEIALSLKSLVDALNYASSGRSISAFSSIKDSLDYLTENAEQLKKIRSSFGAQPDSLKKALTRLENSTSSLIPRVEGIISDLEDSGSGLGRGMQSIFTGICNLWSSLFSDIFSTFNIMF